MHVHRVERAAVSRGEAAEKACAPVHDVQGAKDFHAARACAQRAAASCGGLLLHGEGGASADDGLAGIGVVVVEHHCAGAVRCAIGRADNDLVAAAECASGRGDCVHGQCAACSAEAVETARTRREGGAGVSAAGCNAVQAGSSKEELAVADSAEVQTLVEIEHSVFKRDDAAGAAGIVGDHAGEVGLRELREVVAQRYNRVVRRRADHQKLARTSHVGGSFQMDDRVRVHANRAGAERRRGVACALLQEEQAATIIVDDSVEHHALVGIHIEHCIAHEIGVPEDFHRERVVELHRQRCVANGQVLETDVLVGAACSTLLTQVEDRAAVHDQAVARRAVTDGDALMEGGCVGTHIQADVGGAAPEGKRASTKPAEERQRSGAEAAVVDRLDGAEGAGAKVDIALGLEITHSHDRAAGVIIRTIDRVGQSEAGAGGIAARADQSAAARDLAEESQTTLGSRRRVQIDRGVIARGTQIDRAVDLGIPRIACSDQQRLALFAWGAEEGESASEGQRAGTGRAEAVHVEGGEVVVSTQHETVGKA